MQRTTARLIYNLDSMAWIFNGEYIPDDDLYPADEKGNISLIHMNVDL